MRFCKDHIEINDSYAKCMTIAQYPQQLDDKFIATLLQQVPYIVLSIAIQPVETEDAYREIEDSRMKTDAEKVRFNRKTVENLDFVATVPYKTQAQEKNIEYIRTEMAEHDQQMFLVLLSAAYFADTLDELKAETAALKPRQRTSIAGLPNCVSSRNEPLTRPCRMACGALPVCALCLPRGCAPLCRSMYRR